MKAARYHVGLAVATCLLVADPVAAQVSGSGTTQQPASPDARSETSPPDWSAAAREDVLAAYEIFSRHHPGMFDPHNPGFPRRLRRARDSALAFVARVEDAEGHARALQNFSAGLADGHARVHASYSGRNPPLWPGFRTVWRGSALHILDPADRGPPRGSVLLGCDGRDARAVIREIAFSFGGRPDEAGQWWDAAPNLFFRPASPYETLPRECRFRHPDGRRTSDRLDWRPVPQDLLRAWFQAGSRREPIGLTEPRPGLHLITLSSFSPDEAGLAAYRRLFARLADDAERIAAGRAVVIDLRRNGGGSSRWSREVANGLWGARATNAALARYFRNTRIWWLADPANIAHFRDVASRIRRDGRIEAADEVAAIVGHLETARARGDRFHIEDVGRSFAAQGTGTEPRRLPAVYVIVDGGCASACLDAVDLFTQFPGVKLMGAPTSADTNHMDIRFEPLPSGRGIVVLPTKFWVGRPRASGEVYRPRIPVNDLDWSIVTMLDHVERDLGR